MSNEGREGKRMLSGLEMGKLSVADVYNIADELDPVLVYFVLRYLREKYPPGNPASQGVMERLLELTKTYDDVVKASKQGEKDSMREWFDDTHSMHEFFGDSDAFVDMIVEKLES
jgi:hypothetical protein